MPRRNIKNFVKTLVKKMTISVLNFNQGQTMLHFF